MFKIIPNNKGFTLLELLVAMGIFSLVVVAGAWLMISGFRYNTIIWDQLEGQKEARVGLKRLVDIVREAEQSDIGSYGVATADDYELVVYSNIDSDSYKERVRFWLENETLKMGTIKPSGDPLGYTGTESVVDVAHYVVNVGEGTPLFYYFDEDYTGDQDPLTTPADPTVVKLIKIKFKIEKDPEKTPVPFEVESMVQIRNLKEN